MFCKSDFVQTFRPSREKETVVKFAENIEFTVPKIVKDYNLISIKNVKGDFEITKIGEWHFGCPFESMVDDVKKRSFYLCAKSTYTFYITANIEKNSNNNQDFTHENICDKFESSQNPLTDKSRPESVIPSLSITQDQKLYRIGSNVRYADVEFITSDATKVPSHRNILSEVSTVCAKIFEEVVETPVKINVDDFDAETIQSALEFCYDKHDAINGKEIEVFKFAVKYGFQSLVDTCRLFFEESVDPSNVCEFIQIAYANNFTELKQKCLKIMFENRTEIDSLKIADLPQNILMDAFRFKF